MLCTEGISFNKCYNFHFYETSQQHMKLARFSHHNGASM